MARTEAEQANHDLVLEMYHKVLIAMDSSAVDRYIAPGYVQHSSLAEPTVEALKGFLDRVRTESPDATQTIHRSFVDGDHVITHTHVVRWPDDPGLAVVDIFRVEDGLIVEHWDVIQDVPAQPVNPNSMF
ncbi:nuclear transport factor 2 family protein [Novosphingobium taihuense]|uniref:Putative SnoaL-like aldol condensation-catalyzing enzyme n=1 Tax=Novosphingobium taihuense TaxID=260085 RepID=A0A7W7ES86_9SPHN|nr:nuclear transport factor 2 family protein [Novosphingobium taihuense]MBB4612033.1 putative SnoaL-like aldol condensation-catalyzing enzyme [Novosphingobium taihuense]TWH88614.1 putative SnoaL-like aldol condensation-catalyzing enzyme [Novosphingobium taihuense]